MAELSITCSKCGAEFLIDEAHAGSTVACSQCQSTILVPLAGIKEGMKIADFEIIRRLGVGGMGEVWLAKQVAMDRDVALKILSPALTADEEFVTRFQQEVKMAGKLTHPNIVGAFYAGVDNGINFLAIAYVDGIELEDKMKMEGRVSETEALQITRSIALALKYAWEKFKILHRDIKPSNIMISSDGDPMLMDMGISKSLAEDKNLTMTGMVVGTPYYMSPEQCRADGVLDFRADLYSLGATLYHMVTGTVPYDATNATGIIAKQITEPFPSPKDRVPEITDGCEVLMEIMMAKTADQRQASWDDLVKDIDLVLEGKLPETARPEVGMTNVMQPGYQGTSTQNKTSPQSGDEEKASKLPLILGVLVTLCVLIGVIVAALMMGRDPSAQSSDGNIEPRNTGQASNLSRQSGTSNVEHRIEEKKTKGTEVEGQSSVVSKKTPKTEDRRPKTTIASPKIPADYKKRIEEARTKTGPVLKVNPQNFNTKIKELRPGMVLYLEPGTYSTKSNGGLIRTNNIIVEGGKRNKDSKVTSGFTFNGKNVVIRNLYMPKGNVYMSGKNALIIDSMLGKIGIRSNDCLVFNSVTKVCSIEDALLSLVNCTVTETQANGNLRLFKKTPKMRFQNCVLYWNKKCHVFNSVKLGTQNLIEFKNSLLFFERVSNGKEFVQFAKKAKPILNLNIVDCSFKKPLFANPTEWNFKLLPNSPGQGMGANLDANGYPVSSGVSKPNTNITPAKLSKEVTDHIKQARTVGGKVIEVRSDAITPEVIAKLKPGTVLRLKPVKSKTGMKFQNIFFKGLEKVVIEGTKNQTEAFVGISLIDSKKCVIRNLNCPRISFSNCNTMAVVDCAVDSTLSVNGKKLFFYNSVFSHFAALGHAQVFNCSIQRQVLQEQTKELKMTNCVIAGNYEASFILHNEKIKQKSIILEHCLLNSNSDVAWVATGYYPTKGVSKKIKDPAQLKHLVTMRESGFASIQFKNEKSGNLQLVKPKYSGIGANLDDKGVPVAQKEKGQSKTKAVSGLKLSPSFEKLLKETRAKKQKVLKVNPSNYQFEILKLEPGMTLHFQKGKYEKDGDIVIKADKTIITSDKGVSFKPRIHIKGNKCRVHNFNGHANFINTGRDTLFLDSIFRNLDNQGKGLAFNCLFQLSYTATPNNNSVLTIAHCTIIGLPYLYSVVTKGQGNYKLDCCVILAGQDVVFQVITSNFKKKLEVKNCLIFQGKQPIRMANSYENPDSKHYAKTLKDLGKYINATNCIAQKPSFVNTAKYNYALKPGSPGKKMGYNGRDLGAHFNPNGIPVPVK